jgi:hypothetical protein
MKPETESKKDDLVQQIGKLAESLNNQLSGKRQVHNNRKH